MGGFTLFAPKQKPLEETSDETLICLDGALPFSSQWITIFSVAQEDIGALMKEACELNITQARFLYEVNYARNTNHTGEIARTLFLQANTSSAIVHTLVDAELIRQEPCPEDKRATILYTTKTGEKVARRIDAAVESYGSLLKSTLSKSQLESIFEIGNRFANKTGVYYEKGKKPLSLHNYLSTATIVLGGISANAKIEGLTLIEFRILVAAKTLSQPPRISTLSTHLGLRPNVISIALDKLEDKDCLRRVLDVEDHRAVRVTCTEKGVSLFENICERIHSAMPIDFELLKTIPSPLTTRLYHKQAAVKNPILAMFLSSDKNEDHA